MGSLMPGWDKPEEDYLHKAKGDAAGRKIVPRWLRKVRKNKSDASGAAESPRDHRQQGSVSPRGSSIHGLARVSASPGQAKLHSMREKFASMHQDKPGMHLQRTSESAASRTSSGPPQLKQQSVPVAAGDLPPVDKATQGLLREEGDTDSITWWRLVESSIYNTPIDKPLAYRGGNYVPQYTTATLHQQDAPQERPFDKAPLKPPTAQPAQVAQQAQQVSKETACAEECDKSEIAEHGTTSGGGFNGIECAEDDETRGLLTGLVEQEHSAMALSGASTPRCHRIGTTSSNISVDGSWEVVK